MVSLSGLSLTWLLKWSVGVNHGHADARLEPAYLKGLIRNFRWVAAANVAAAVLVFQHWPTGLGLSVLLIGWLLLPPKTPRYFTEAPVIEGEG